jgi:hypothetical protein
LVDACDVVPSAEALVSDTEDFAAEVKRLSPVEEPVAVSTRSVRLLMPVPVPVLPVGRLSEERPLVIEDKLPIDGSALPPVRELSPARPLPVVREDREDVLGKTPDVPLLGSRLVMEESAAVASPAVEPVMVEKSMGESYPVRRSLRSGAACAH